MSEHRVGPLTHGQRRALLWAEAFRMAVTLLLVVGVLAVWYGSFTGRTAVVHSLRDGCERTRVRIHALAADASGRGADRLARRLLGTIPAKCEGAYPDPGPFAH